MEKNLTYVDGELQTQYGNCFEVGNTLEELYTYIDDKMTLYFYSYKECYHIQYQPQKEIFDIITDVLEETDVKLINWYWNENRKAELKKLINMANGNNDDIINIILQYMDEYSRIRDYLRDIEADCKIKELLRG